MFPPPSPAVMIGLLLFGSLAGAALLPSCEDEDYKERPERPYNVLCPDGKRSCQEGYICTPDSERCTTNLFMCPDETSWCVEGNICTPDSRSCVRSWTWCPDGKSWCENGWQCTRDSRRCYDDSSDDVIYVPLVF